MVVGGSGSGDRGGGRAKVNREQTLDRKFDVDDERQPHTRKWLNRPKWTRGEDIGRKIIQHAFGSNYGGYLDFSTRNWAIRWTLGCENPPSHPLLSLFARSEFTKPLAHLEGSILRKELVAIRGR